MILDVTIFLNEFSLGRLKSKKGRPKGLPFQFFL